MKLFVISDIHGSLNYAKKSLEAFEKEKADFLVILGDILYHGPRNPLPESYDPKSVAELLNKINNKIIAVRGNCDSEVDQMLLDFPIMSDFSTVLWNDKRVFLTHGHIFNKENLPNLASGDILISGHTHIPLAEIHMGIFMLNPGSAALPKENHPNSYGIFDKNRFQVKSFHGDIIKEISLGYK